MYFRPDDEFWLYLHTAYPQCVERFRESPYLFAYIIENDVTFCHGVKHTDLVSYNDHYVGCFLVRDTSIDLCYLGRGVYLQVPNFDVRERLPILRKSDNNSIFIGKFECL